MIDPTQYVGPVCYLICFDRPLAHARHYLGYAENLSGRMKCHRSGNGARLVAAVMRAGIGWRLVRVWPEGSRQLERKLKRQHKSRCLCPVCRVAA